MKFSPLLNLTTVTVSALSFALLLSATTSTPPAWSDEPTEPANSPSLFKRVERKYFTVAAHDAVFYYVSQADRVKIINEFFDAVTDQYSLLKIKQDRFHLNLDTLRAESIAQEKIIGDFETPVDRAQGNLEFYDRMRALVSQFQDTHFSVSPVQTMRPVLIPILLAKADGKYVINNTYPKLLSYLSLQSNSPAFSQIALGDEIISIDGHSVEDEINRLKPYISGSSDESRMQDALYAVTFRAFRFPANPTTTVVIKKKSDASLVRLTFPWLHRTMQRQDQALLFAFRGYRPYEDLRIEYDQLSEKWRLKDTPYLVESVEATTPKLIDEKRYDTDDHVIRAGLLFKNSKLYGVLQIFTFGEPKVLNSDGKSIDFIDAIREVVSDFNAKKIPLILDLRSNPGGDGNLPPLVFGTLLPASQFRPGPTAALRVTRNAIQIVDESDSSTAQPTAGFGVDPQDYKHLIAVALRNNEEYTAAYSKNDITTDKIVGGFNQKIVTLISTNCVSACDITAALLSTSKISTLIGQPTSGTGAGFISLSDALSASWIDSQRFIQSNIPNFLFGVPGPNVTEHIFAGKAEEFNLENRPTSPSKENLYQPTVNDITKMSVDWFDKAIEVLDKK